MESDLTVSMCRPPGYWNTRFCNFNKTAFFMQERSATALNWVAQTANPSVQMLRDMTSL